MGSERSAGGFQSRATYAVPTPNASLRCAGGALKPARSFASRQGDQTFTVLERWAFLAICSQQALATSLP